MPEYYLYRLVVLVHVFLKNMLQFMVKDCLHTHRKKQLFPQTIIPILPHRLEGPPSYKPPTPKAKLEEPEMVSTFPGAQAAPTSPPTFPH